MVIVPSSTITLYGDVKITEGEQIAFSSKTKQSAYFASKVKSSMVKCTMIKKTGALRVSIASSIIIQCNYLSFINTNWDNKVIYAHITDYNYINNETTEISYTIDAFQTWMFDVKYDDMYIARENLSQADWNKLELDPYDQTVLEIKTPETLTIGKSVEENVYSISDGVTGEGGSLFYESSAETEEWLDVLFVSDIDWNKLDDEGNIYTGEIWENYLKYTKTTSNPLSYSDWRELHGYGGKLPSTLYEEAIKGGYSSYWAIYWNNEHVWWIDNGAGSYNVKTPNTNMNMPYSIYIFNHETMIKLIDVLNQTGCVSSIMGMYTLPKRVLNNFLDVDRLTVFNTVEIETSKTRQGTAVKSHKLLNFPYSYFTLDDADGNAKEYHYEDTYKNETDFKVEINTTVDLNSQPTLVAVTPRGPKQGTGGYGDFIDNAVVYDAIPQTPYMTDSYLAFVAESAKSIVGQNTSDFGYQLEQQQFNNNMSVIRTTADLSAKLIDTTVSAATLASGRDGGNIISFGGTMNTGIDAYASGKGYEIAQNKLQNTQNMIESAVSTLGGDTHSTVAQNFSKCKPAYASNIYHAGSRGGILHYLNAVIGGMTKPDIYYIHHKLNDQIRTQYDLYFQQFGYTSNRCGIPRVCNFITGSTDISKTPHWETVNGLSVNYVQVATCNVTHSMSPVANYFKILFQNGCRFINGDTLPLS